MQGGSRKEAIEKLVRCHGDRIHSARATHGVLRALELDDRTVLFCERNSDSVHKHN